MNIQSKSRYHEVYARAQRDPEGFWAEAAREIDWVQPAAKEVKPPPVAASPDQFPKVLWRRSSGTACAGPSVRAADAAGAEKTAADSAPESAKAAAVRRRAEDIGVSPISVY